MAQYYSQSIGTNTIKIYHTSPYHWDLSCGFFIALPTHSHFHPWYTNSLALCHIYSTEILITFPIQKKEKIQMSMTILPRRKDIQTFKPVLFHGLWPVVCLDNQRLGENTVGILATRWSGEDACGKNFSYVHRRKTYMSHENAHQEMTSAEITFNK